MKTFRKPKGTKKYSRISRSLLFWFLILALVPLSLVSSFSYFQAKESLTEAAVQELEELSNLNIRFIKNWFDYRVMDINLFAESVDNADLLMSLVKGYKKSNQPIKEYVKSYDWIKRVQGKNSKLNSIHRRYDYIYDIFLIDNEGNIIFTLAREDDFGTNLFYGVYSDTRFAESVKTTLETGETRFSGLERYYPSNNQISGFMSAPLQNDEGDNIGVFAIQLRLDRIMSLFVSQDHRQASMIHYLVGDDKKLRTPINENIDEILVREINTEQVQLFIDVHNKTSAEHNNDLEKVFEYSGPEGEVVFGQHQVFKMPGINWILISEINRDEALHAVSLLAEITMIVLLVTMVVVILLSMMIARRITNPIESLADMAMNAAEGAQYKKVIVSANNEIEKLADAFNHMLQKRAKRDKELEQKTLESQQALKELAEQKFALDQHSIVAITDAAGNITFANNKFAEISGYSPKELIGQNHRILNSGYHPPAFFKEMYETISAGKVWQGEIRNCAKNGKLYWVDTTIVPFFGDEGKPKSFVAIRTDITERKRSELALEKSEAHARGIFESAADGIITIDTAGVIQEFNPAAERIFGYLNKEVVNKNVVVLMPETYRQKHVEGMVRYLETNTAHILDLNVEAEGLRKDGSIFPMELSVSEVVTGSERLFTALTRDITQRKMVEDEMVRARDLAEDAAKAKSEFLASMSHEIRTPMNGVLGMLNLLHNTELDDVQKHRVKIAEKSAQSLLGLINDILDFSKVEAGKLDLEVLDFDLRGMAGDFSEAMGQQAQGKGLELILDLTGVNESKIIGDPARIRQVLTNLVGNAIKFTEQGEVIIRMQLIAKENNQLLLEGKIEDTGIGIVEDKLDKLFDSFSQVDASTTRKYGGTGLGLTIAKRLCELMAGDISVSSEVDKGSCFTFTMMLSKSLQSKPVVPNIDIQSMHILVVDNNASNRDVLHQQFRLWGASVTCAENGKQALQKLEEKATEENKNYFDIAFIDLQMPIMDGVELGKLIRRDSRYNQTKLVMMTNMNFHGDSSRFIELGFSSYFPKPATTSDLFDALSVISLNGESKTLETKSDKAQGEESITLWDSSTRVLLVEDNQVNQIVAMTTLESIGVSVEVAGNGIEAIEALRHAPEDARFSLIFMDCQMPEMDGFEASRKIREGDGGKENIGIPIVALTANAMKEDKEQCLQAGMDDYLAKPYEQEQLEAKLTDWLSH